MKRVSTALLLLATVAVSSSAAQPPERAGVVDVRNVGSAPGTSFESLWVSYTKAERAGDAANARRVFQEIRRIRIERNVASHETLGLALVAQGLERLDKGERDRAEESFRNAIGLAPSLPDAQFALSLTDLNKGPLGFLPAIRHTAAGLFARLPTVRGSYHLAMLLVPVVLIGLLATAAMLAVAFVLRRGALLRHDLAESLGPGRSASVSLAFYAGLLLLPVATFQGYGWLPLWWITLLFVYLSVGREGGCPRGRPAGPRGRSALTSNLESHLLAARNPLFWAGVPAVESGRGPALGGLARGGRAEGPRRQGPCLSPGHPLPEGGSLRRRRRALPEGAPDGTRRRHRQEQPGQPRVRPWGLPVGDRAVQAGSGGGSVRPRAWRRSSTTCRSPTCRRFEYQPAEEAKSNADRLARSLIADYDRTWKYDKGDYAVVDLGLVHRRRSATSSWARAEGVGAKNVVTGRGAGEADRRSRARSSTASRASWRVRPRGGGALGLAAGECCTLHCLKCGQIFDARDHRGGAAVGLCPQCYHLFVVRDGVSAPARNRKLLEVQGGTSGAAACSACCP